MVLIAGLSLVAMLSIALLARIGDHPFLYRDPTQPSATVFHESMMDEDRLVEPAYDGVVDSIVLSTNTGRIDLVMPAYHALHDHVDNGLFDYHFIDPAGSFESKAGRIWIEHIAVAHGEFPTERQTEESHVIVSRFFDPDLREWTADEIERRLSDGDNRTLDFHGAYPSVCFQLRSSLSEEAVILGARAFDARTHHPIDGAFSIQGSLNDTLKISGDLRMWHPAPIELVLDLALGPPEVIELDATPSTSARYSGGELTLLVKAGGMRNLSALTTGTETEVALIAEPERDKGSTCLLFASLPKAQSWPLEIECLDRDGRVLPKVGSATFNIFKRENVDADVGAVHSVRARYFNTRVRLVFRLDEIPGLPLYNRDVDNLMDVRIPYLKVDREYEFNELIGSLTQMSMPGVGLSGGQFPSPMVFRDVTVAELVETSARLHGPKHGVLIDQRVPSIEFPDLSFRARVDRLWDRMSSTFR